MKYLVDIAGSRTVVDFGPRGILVDGKSVTAVLEVVEGTPIVLLRWQGTLQRLAVQRGETRGRFAIWTDDYRFEVEALDERRRAIQALSGVQAGGGGPAPLIAPMPGLVVRINVQSGDRVQPGQPLVVMEAMKMENELRATSGGIVGAVRAQPGTAVEKGAILVELVAGE